MGKIGTRRGDKQVHLKYDEPELPHTPPKNKDKRKYDNKTHHELCCKAAKWLRTRWYKNKPYADFAVVEIVTQGYESPDVFGWNSTYSTMIEVKVTHSDFLNDKKKRIKHNSWNGTVGEYKFYFCPTNIIKVDELPDGWGLLYIDKDDKITIEKWGDKLDFNYIGEREIINSILRREGVKKQIFNYKK